MSNDVVTMCTNRVYIACALRQYFIALCKPVRERNITHQFCIQNLNAFTIITITSNVILNANLLYGTYLGFLEVDTSGTLLPRYLSLNYAIALLAFCFISVVLHIENHSITLWQLVIIIQYVQHITIYCYKQIVKYGIGSELWHGSVIVSGKCGNTVQY